MSSKQNSLKKQEIVIQSGNLAGLDKLEAEAVGLFCFTDQRPLRGVAAVIDWRLDGALSQLMLRGRFRGELHEQLMLPSALTRLGQRRFFAFGLGSIKSFNHEQAVLVVRSAIDTMKQASVKKITLAAPAVSGDDAVQQNFILWLQESFKNEVRIVLTLS
ncbi:hypothetical protein KAI87_13275 [Myxococcota bacterium]|nr:hypothetical protein [Myxococcota bacterium]